PIRCLWKGSSPVRLANKRLPLQPGPAETCIYITGLRLVKQYCSCAISYRVKEKHRPEKSQYVCSPARQGDSACSRERTVDACLVLIRTQIQTYRLSPG